MEYSASQHRHPHQVSAYNQYMALLHRAKRISYPEYAALPYPMALVRQSGYVPDSICRSAPHNPIAFAAVRQVFANPFPASQFPIWHATAAAHPASGWQAYYYLHSFLDCFLDSAHSCYIPYIASIIQVDRFSA